MGCIVYNVALLIALIAMIGMSALLGYIAITPNASVANPSINYLFLILMVTLTVLLAISIAVRPMRFSPDELRLGAIGALVPGPLILLYGVYKLTKGGPPPHGGPGGPGTEYTEAVMKTWKERRGWS